MVVACIALFAALGGIGYAAAKINGKQIKKTSIAGNRLKPDGVTGRQVDEAKLGKVPAAQSADDAQTLAGTGPDAFVGSGDVRGIDWEVIDSAGGEATTATLAEIGGLRLIGSCSHGGQTAELSAASSAAGNGIDLGFIRGSSAESEGAVLTSTPTSLLTVGGSGFSRAIGTAVYQDNETTITVPFAVVYIESGPTARCLINGTAFRAADTTTPPSLVQEGR